MTAYDGPPRDLANMRQNGLRALYVVCNDCHHEADVNVDDQPSQLSIPDPALVHPIAIELRRAWVNLGGVEDHAPRHGDSLLIYDAFQRQGADSELLAIIGSYGDTLPDSSVLQYLREWNAGRPVIAQVVAKAR